MSGGAQAATGSGGLEPVRCGYSGGDRVDAESTGAAFTAPGNPSRLCSR